MPSIGVQQEYMGKDAEHSDINSDHHSHPIDWRPPMNSCFENSHIVAAFICQEITSCK